jgi:hypothetical protein
MTSIDDAFVAEWHPKYELYSPDESEYLRLVKLVAQDMAATGTISRPTFRGIWKWKGPQARRATPKLRLDQYYLYAAAFRRAAAAPPASKLDDLLWPAPNLKLPGLGAPIGSTFLHFMHPRTMPIMDSRAAECLHQAGLFSTPHTYPTRYNEFRHAMDGICSRCPRWTLRQVDRALMAYHKIMLDKSSRHRCG